MKYGSLVGLAAVAITALPTDALAERCVGSWGGTAPTTVTFNDGNQLRYCYGQQQCWDAEWVGDKAKKLMFRFGDGGATVEMKAVKGGYSADYRYGSDSAHANLKCN